MTVLSPSLARIGARPDAGAWSLMLWRLAPLLGAALLFGLAAFNSRPVVFSDTAYYVWQGQTAAQLLRLDLNGPGAGRDTEPSRAARPPDTAELWRQTISIAGARSPVYGLPMYALVRAGSGWAVVAVQALAAALAVWLATRAVLGRADPVGFALALGTAALGSTLVFFTGFVMPDVFAGVAVLLACVLVCGRETVSARARAEAAAALATCLAMHGSLPLMALALAACVALAGGLGIVGARRGTGRDGAVVGLAAVAAVALLAGYAALFTAVTGDRQTSPPFLTASLIAEGPGRTYLRAACARGERFELCRFAHRPLADVEEVLWHRDASAIFQAMDSGSRAQMRADEPRFVREVTLSDPVGVLWGMIHRSAGQLFSPDVEDPLRSDGGILRGPFGHSLLTLAIPDQAGCLREGDRCDPKAPYGLVTLVDRAGLVISLAALAFGFWRARQTSRGKAADDAAVRRAARFGALTLLAVLINACVCGGVSAVSARYEARLIWVVPVAAVLLWRALLAARTASAPTEHQQQVGRPT